MPPKYHITTVTAAQNAAQRRAIAINYAVMAKNRYVKDVEHTYARNLNRGRFNTYAGEQLVLAKRLEAEAKVLAKQIADNREHAKYLRALAYVKKNPAKRQVPDKGWITFEDDKITKNRSAAQKRLAASRARKQMVRRSVVLYKNK